eukprot:GSA25T00025587001.1
MVKTPDDMDRRSTTNVSPLLDLQSRRSATVTPDQTPDVKSRRSNTVAQEQGLVVPARGGRGSLVARKDVEALRPEEDQMRGLEGASSMPKKSLRGLRGMMESPADILQSQAVRNYRQTVNSTMASAPPCSVEEKPRDENQNSIQPERTPAPTTDKPNPKNA